VGCGVGVSDRGSEVVPCEHDRAGANMREQRVQILGHNVFLVAVNRPLGIADAAHVRGDHRVIPGERGHDVAPPFAPGLGEAVQKDDWLAGSSGHIVLEDAIRANGVMP